MLGLEMTPIEWFVDVTFQFEAFSQESAYNIGNGSGGAYETARIKRSRKKNKGDRNSRQCPDHLITPHRNGRSTSTSATSICRSEISHPFSFPILPVMVGVWTRSCLDTQPFFGDSIKPLMYFLYYLFVKLASVIICDIVSELTEFVIGITFMVDMTADI
ncbi:hypothetical protein QE152_g24388 [Popillia japonica]|uniref:Uncharacterized protein n=1 Tax=Popillia japonica TaxID=7064 RepID=A0AAW1KF53_POPJA